VMRNYSDQEDSQTSGASKKSLMGNSYVAPPPPKTEKTEPTNPMPPKSPVKRVSIVPVPETKPITPAVRRNSIELIEGVKRRDIDMP
jgi:hypothetical protein